MSDSQTSAATNPARTWPKLGRIQAASGAIFALFLLLHLTTASSGLLGVSGYDRTLVLLRQIYRPHLIVELGIIGLSASVHIACALLQMVRRKKLFAWSGPWWMRAHRLSGYFLLMVIVGHVFATRIAPLLATGPTATGKADFAFLAFSALKLPLFFWPYYILLGIAGATHLGIGLHLASRILRRRIAPSAGSVPTSEHRAAGAGSSDKSADKSAPKSAARSGGAPSHLYLMTVAAVAVIVVAGVVGILSRAADAPRTRFPEYQALRDKLLP